MEWSLKFDDNLPGGDKFINIGKLQVSSSGDIALVGRMQKSASSVDDSFLAMLNESGQLQWIKSYGFLTANFRA